MKEYVRTHAPKKKLLNEGWLAGMRQFILKGPNDLF